MKVTAVVRLLQKPIYHKLAVIHSKGVPRCSLRKKPASSGAASPRSDVPEVYDGKAVRRLISLVQLVVQHQARLSLRVSNPVLMRVRCARRWCSQPGPRRRRSSARPHYMRSEVHGRKPRYQNVVPGTPGTVSRGHSHRRLPRCTARGGRVGEVDEDQEQVVLRG